LLQSYHQRRLALENEWNATVSAFIKENEPSTTSNLAEATIENILYELRRRSFSGIITDTETGRDFDINKAEWKREE